MDAMVEGSFNGRLRDQKKFRSTLMAPMPKAENMAVVLIVLGRHLVNAAKHSRARLKMSSCK
jgi:hypothetical protein